MNTMRFKNVVWSESDNPEDILQKIASEYNLRIEDREFCRFLDANDELREFKSKFIFPRENSKSKRVVTDTENDLIDQDNCIYLAGNDVGLVPKAAKDLMLDVLDSWATKTTLCHTMGPLRALDCENHVTEQMAKLVGADDVEVICMNSMEVNLHLLLVSFYQPKKHKYKILIENKYSLECVLQSHLNRHGSDAESGFVRLCHQDDDYLLNEEKIIELIKTEGSDIALIFLPGLISYSGQLLDMERITKCGHEKGCMVGFDLSDCAGNTELDLHKWGVDFACWSTEKYLNSGLGALGVAFMHERHSGNNFNKFHGWWSHDVKSRFEMTNKIVPNQGVMEYCLSNQSPLAVAPIKANLDIVDETSRNALRCKRFLLTGYLMYLFEKEFMKDGTSNSAVQIITPKDFRRRGSAISFRMAARQLTAIYNQLCKHGVSITAIAPDIICVALVPLYCNFHDVFKFVAVLRDVISQIQ